MEKIVSPPKKKDQELLTQQHKSPQGGFSEIKKTRDNTTHFFLSASYLRRTTFDVSSVSLVENSTKRNRRITERNRTWSEHGPNMVRSGSEESGIMFTYKREKDQRMKWVKEKLLRYSKGANREPFRLKEKQRKQR